MKTQKYHPNDKRITTKNGNEYVGYFLPNGQFRTTFGWTLDAKVIKTVKDW